MATSSKKNLGWHPEDIKAAIRKKKRSLSSLAVSVGLSESAVSKALQTPNKAAEEAISKFLNIPLHELWPNRWTKNGKRIYPRYAHKYNTNCELVA